MVSTREFARLKEERDALLKKVEELQEKLDEYDKPSVLDWDKHESEN